MTVITNLRVPLSLDDVTRAWGSRRARLASPRMLSLVTELLERVDTENWLQPAVSFRAWPVVESGPGWMELSGGSRLRASLLSHYLRGASHLALGVCTVGAAIENHVSEWFAANERLRADVLNQLDEFFYSHKISLQSSPWIIGEGNTSVPTADRVFPFEGLDGAAAQADDSRIHRLERFHHIRTPQPEHSVLVD